MLCRSTRGEFEKFRAISDERCTCHLSEAGIATAVPRTRLQESSMRSQTTFLDDYLFAIIRFSRLFRSISTFICTSKTVLKSSRVTLQRRPWQKVWWNLRR